MSAAIFDRRRATVFDRRLQLTQVLVRSDAVAGSYTAAEGATDTVGGSDGFTMTETQTEMVEASGSITGGSDTYAYDEG